MKDYVKEAIQFVICAIIFIALGTIWLLIVPNITINFVFGILNFLTALFFTFCAVESIKYKG